MMQNARGDRAFGRGPTQSRFDFTNLSDSARNRGGRTSRGGWAPRNARGGRRAPPRPDIAKHPLGELLEQVKNSDIQAQSQCEGKDAVITDCTYVASYNWQSGEPPTIIVPGKPALWTPLSKPRQLNEDKGVYFRDYNAARFPEYPIEPAVQALLKHSSRLTSGIDIFACGSTLGNLLRFVRSIEKPFRFTVELVGNTVFLLRKENDPRELLEDVRGFGHTFPEAYTTWEADVKRSQSHQRLVQYQFGGLKCIVRFECDGYIREQTGNTDPPHPKEMDKEGNSQDTLTRAFHQTTVSQEFTYVSGPLSVISGGSAVPQPSIFDLKTRSGKYKKEIDMDEFLPILYLKQIPNFIVAYHNGSGLFPAENIHVRDIRQDLNQWEAENGEALNRLAILLKKIVDIAKTDKIGLLEVYAPSVHHLEVRRQHGDGSHVLSLPLRDRWAGLSEQQHSKVEPSKCKVSGKVLNRDDSVLEDSDSDDDGGVDFTGCSAETCGYCGSCSY